MKIDSLRNVQVTLWALDNPDLAKIKRGWADGPWKKEFDRIFWEDVNTGYHCLVTRHPSMGFLAGYVGIPRYHEDYGREPHMINLPMNLAPHGGLEYGGFSNKDDENFRPYVEVFNAPVYWAGFDAAHGSDLIPAFAEAFKGKLYANYIYREVDYMIQEVLELAKALFENNAPLTIDNYK